MTLREQIAAGGGLVTVAGMARAWEVSPQAVYGYVRGTKPAKVDGEWTRVSANRHPFPEPLPAARGTDAKVWLYDDVAEWRLLNLKTAVKP